MIARGSYQILDLHVHLESDHAGLFQRFQQDYEAFRTPTENDTIREPRTELVLTAHLNGSAPHLSVNGRQYSLAGHPHPPSGAYSLLLKEIFARVRRFLLIHASVAVMDGAALILSGRGGIGKTTLLLRLVDEGFTFYSDDVCPIERTSGLVFPFQRTAWIKGKEPDKQPVRIAGGDRSQLKPCRPRVVLLLTEGELRRRDVVIRVHFKEQAGSTLELALRSLDGVEVLKGDSVPNSLRIKCPTDGDVGNQLRGLLNTHSDELWSALTLDSAEQTDFAGEPQARRIGPGEMALFLAGQLKQDVLQPGSELTTPGRLIFELSNVLGETSVYQIKTGRLESLVRLVRKIWEETAHCSENTAPRARNRR